MKIVINTAHQRFGGAVQVATSFIYECRNYPDNSYEVWLGPGTLQNIDVGHFPSNFRFKEFDFGPVSVFKLRNLQRVLSNVEVNTKPDVIISTSGPSYFQSLAPQVIGFNLPLYLYNESPFIRDLSMKAKFKLALKKQAHLFYFKRDASAYLTQTDDVNNRIQNLLKTKNVYTVTNTYNHYFNNYKKYTNRLSVPNENEFRLLTLSAWYPHKNLELIPEIAKLFQTRGIENIRFILTLPDHQFKRHIKPHPYIINTGPVEAKACPSLYNECDGMFLPTLAECFSASYPEAMKMQKPIITTNLGFAKSICGNAANYFSPKDPNDACEAILEVAEDKFKQHRLIENGLAQLQNFDTAESRAQKYLDICRKYAGKTSRN